jgi:hypothetical protein
VSLCELINNSIDESFDVLKYTGVWNINRNCYKSTLI